MIHSKYCPVYGVPTQSITTGKTIYQFMGLTVFEFKKIYFEIYVDI